MALTVCERELLHVAIALVEDTAPTTHIPTIVRAGTPTGLSREGMAALSRVYSRGLARRLARAGGSPLWEKAPPLRFSSASLDLVSWLYTTPISPRYNPPLVLRARPTAVETLLFARAFDLLGAAGVRAPPDAFFELPWLWALRGERLLAHRPVDLALAERLDDEGWMLSVCHRELRGGWGQWCRAVRAAEPVPTVTHGTAQAALAESILERSADRPERAAFLLDLLPSLAALPPGVWEVAREEMTLAAWQRTRQARVALLDVVTAHAGRFGERWRATGFLDDDYTAAQRWLRRFEPGLSAIRSLRRPVERARHLPELS